MIKLQDKSGYLDRVEVRQEVEASYSAAEASCFKDIEAAGIIGPDSSTSVASEIKRKVALWHCCNLL